MAEIGTIENDVLIGANGYLFFAGGKHRVFDVFMGSVPIPEQSYDTFKANIQGRLAWARRNNAQFKHIIMPDKQSIIPEAWPIPTPIKIGETYIKRVPGLAHAIMYPAAALAAEKSRAVRRVDTHLSDYGSLLVTKRLVERLTGADPSAGFRAILEAEKRTRKNSGDLGCKIVPNQFETEELLEWPPPGPFFHNDKPGASNGGVDLRFNPAAPHPQRLVMFGDSFGRQICRFLQYWYREVYFFRSGVFHAEIADLCKPDIVVTENVERYLDDCPADETREHFLLYRPVKDNYRPPTPEFLKVFAAVLSYPRPPYHEVVGKILAETGYAAPPAERVI